MYAYSVLFLCKITVRHFLARYVFSFSIRLYLILLKETQCTRTSTQTMPLQMKWAHSKRNKIKIIFKTSSVFCVVSSPLPSPARPLGSTHLSIPFLMSNFMRKHSNIQTNVAIIGWTIFSQSHFNNNKMKMKMNDTVNTVHQRNCSHFCRTDWSINTQYRKQSTNVKVKLWWTFSFLHHTICAKTKENDEEETKFEIFWRFIFK